MDSNPASKGKKNYGIAGFHPKTYPFTKNFPNKKANFPPSESLKEAKLRDPSESHRHTNTSYKKKKGKSSKENFMERHPAS